MLWALTGLCMTLVICSGIMTFQIWNRWRHLKVAQTDADTAQRTTERPLILEMNGDIHRVSIYELDEYHRQIAREVEYLSEGLRWATFYLGLSSDHILRVLRAVRKAHDLGLPVLRDKTLIDHLETLILRLKLHGVPIPNFTITIGKVPDSEQIYAEWLSALIKWFEENAELYEGLREKAIQSKQTEEEV